MDLGELKCLYGDSFEFDFGVLHAGHWFEHRPDELQSFLGVERCHFLLELLALNQLDV